MLVHVVETEKLLLLTGSPKHGIAPVLVALELQTHLSSSLNLSNLGISIAAHFLLAGPFPLLPEEKKCFSLFEKPFLSKPETHARVCARLISLERQLGYGNVQRLLRLNASYL